MADDLKSFWLSWYCAHEDWGKFELRWPWWVSGQRMFDDAYTICAAVRAASTDDAMKIIEHCYDKPTRVEWRFCEVRAADWSPFSDRFTRGDWMQWPDGPPAVHSKGGGQ